MDILERLRRVEQGDDVLTDAAAEIEVLRAEVARLRGIIAAEMLETGSCGTGAFEQKEPR